MMSTRHFVLCVLCSVSIAACGSTVNKDLDDAYKALNDGNYAGAIASATSATTADPTNLEAFLALCSGYSGQAGVNLLEITRQLTDTSTEDQTFDLVHDTLLTNMTATGCAIGTCLSDLNTAITTLTGFTGTIANYSAYLRNQYYFQQGILQYVQALGLPTLTAQPTASGTITPGDITAAIATTTQTDFIDGYAALTDPSTGIATDNSLATTLSKNYCVLKNVYTLGGGNTFLTALQDLTVCQLDPTYAGPFASPGVATCATLNFAVCDGTTAPAL